MLELYSSVLFDCDGVILDSNKIKTNAFYLTTIKYGEENANKLVKYHLENGGISRNLKFKYFIKDILQMCPSQKLYDDLLGEYSKNAFKGLLESNIANNLKEIRNSSNHRWYVVSGGNEKEIKSVFSQRKINEYFNGGIFGSPRNKIEIFKDIMSNKDFKKPAVYLGDSKYDYEASKKAMIDFIFIYEWTEFKNWKKFCNDNKIKYVKNLQCLFLKK